VPLNCVHSNTFCSGGPKTGKKGKCVLLYQFHKQEIELFNLQFQLQRETKNKLKCRLCSEQCGRDKKEKQKWKVLTYINIFKKRNRVSEIWYAMVERECDSGVYSSHPLST